MPTHFRLGAIGYPRALYTAEKIGTVVEKAHQQLTLTRSCLIRQNSTSHDGVLHLRRPSAAPDVIATFEFNVNAPPTSVIPAWVSEAVEHLSGLRVVTTQGFEPVGRVS